METVEGILQFFSVEVWQVKQVLRAMEDNVYSTGFWCVHPCIPQVLFSASTASVRTCFEIRLRDCKGEVVVFVGGQQVES
jgi:hypothetical protein